jgi:hypothetical protein
MSWSFACIGKPAAVAAAIEAHGEKLSGQSRVEFDAAKPHLVALVKENFALPGSSYAEPLIDFEASGSGTTHGPPGSEAQVQRQCHVSVKPVWKALV